MKYSIFLALSFISTSILAQETETTTTTSDKKNQVIVIQDPHGTHTKDSSKVFVENGSDTVQGSPEDSIQGAYRTWKSACSEWKHELQRLNTGNLLFASCGSPKRSSEMNQAQKIYTYSSKGSFKIRVANK